MLISSLIQQCVFYVFTVILIASSVMVITSRNPVRGVLFLILAFFASAALWLLLEAEFLALILIVVYVGAVMTLFLFIVMMLDVNLPKQQSFVRYLPLGILVFAVLLAVMIAAFIPSHFGFHAAASVSLSPQISNVVALGQVLYTTYLYPFELAGVLLLVAIISAISLAFRGRRVGTKGQKAAEQIMINRAERMHIIKMPAEKKL